MSKLKQILNAVDQKVIDRDFITPCRMAEQSYREEDIVPDTFDKFSCECSNYWNHLHSYYYKTQKTFSNIMGFGMAMKRIDQVLGTKGGLRMAFEKARTETFGSVKNMITNAFIGELINDYIGAVLKTYINPYDYNEKKELMKDYVELMNLHGISEGDFQQMVSHYEIVIRSHVKHHTQMEQDRKFGMMMG